MLRFFGLFLILFLSVEARADEQSDLKTAIAFQFSNANCSIFSFHLTPLENGVPGKKQSVRAVRFNKKSNDKYVIVKKDFLSDHEVLNIKAISPGDYIVTRPVCETFNGGRKFRYTKSGRPSDAVHLKISVRPNETNYLGLIIGGMGIEEKIAKFLVQDSFELAEKSYSKIPESRKFGPLKKNFAVMAPPE